MNITLEVKDFLTGLKKVQPATKGKTTLPILSTILLTVKTEDTVSPHLAIRATDLGVDLACQVVPAVSQGLFDYGLDPGSACVPGKLLVDLIGDMKAGHVSLEYDDRAGRTTVSRPDGSARYQVDSYPAEEFPSGWEAGRVYDEILIGENIFQAAVSRALQHVVSDNDATRAAMCGVHMTVNPCPNPTLTLRATNGRHLYRESIPIMSCDLKPERRATGEPLRWNLHGGLLSKALPGMLGAVRVRVGESRVGLISAGGSACLQILEGAFPDVDRVIPVSPSMTFRADRLTLLSAISRAVRCAKEEQSPNLLILEFGSAGLTITSNTPGVGSALESVPGEWRGPDGFQVGMNGAYLSRCLEVYEGVAVILGGSSAEGAWSVTGESLEDDRVAVLSPVRLRAEVQDQDGDN